MYTHSSYIANRGFTELFNILYWDVRKYKIKDILNSILALI